MSEEKDFVFPQRLLRGFGLLKTQSSSVPHYAPQPFAWNGKGGYWATEHGQPKPTTVPPGASSASGEWIETVPYGQRISVDELHHGILLTGGSVWIWYPLKDSAPQWMGDQVWAVFSDKPPTVNPSSPGTIVPGLKESDVANSWVTTAGGYWIWVYTKPVPLLEVP